MFFVMMIHSNLQDIYFMVARDGNVRESSKSKGFILWGMTIQPKVINIFQDLQPVVKIEYVLTLLCLHQIHSGQRQQRHI